MDMCQYLRAYSYVKLINRYGTICGNHRRMARYKLCREKAGGDWDVLRAGYWKAMGITKAYIAVGLTQDEAKLVINYNDSAFYDFRKSVF